MDSKESEINGLGDNEENIDFAPLQNPEVRAYFDKYSGAAEDLIERFKSAHPLHPKTSQPGEFVGFVYKYPLYRTESGEEFVLQRGEPKTVRRLDK